VISARRLAQMMGAPVVDYVLPVIVVARQAFAAVKIVIGASAAALVAVAPDIAPVVVAIAVVPALRQFNAAAMVAGFVTLGERESARGQTRCHDGGNNRFSLHVSSSLENTA
jgi:hypothetical protein